jgi:hypothetical protein
MRIPVLAALLACVATLFRSRTSLRLENLALRHQLAVYKQAVRRPRLRPSDRLLWTWLSRVWPGWQERRAGPRVVGSVGQRLRGFRPSCTVREEKIL